MEKDALIQTAFELLQEIKENVGICCAITMDPDDVESLINELEDILNKISK
jgi:hypothetical protein